jgi:MFS family permease
MELDEIKKVWDQQNEKPVFSINNPGLHIALNQQRQKGIRGLYLEIIFGMSIFLGCLAFMLFNLYYKDIFSPWDIVGWITGVLAIFSFFIIKFLKHKKFINSQRAVTHSLREELEYDISQLNYTFKGMNIRLFILENSLLLAGLSLIIWESGRSNGDPCPWKLVILTLLIVAIVDIILYFLIRRVRDNHLIPRRKALESVLAYLEDESE